MPRAHLWPWFDFKIKRRPVPYIHPWKNTPNILPVHSHCVWKRLQQLWGQEARRATPSRRCVWWMHVLIPNIWTIINHFTFLQTPKSVSLTWPSLVSITLSGFRSLCTMPLCVGEWTTSMGCKTSSPPHVETEEPAQSPQCRILP